MQVSGKSKCFLIVLASFFVFSCSKRDKDVESEPEETSSSWSIVSHAIYLIGQDDPNLQELVKIGQKSKQPWLPHSDYSLAFKKYYDEVYLDRVEVLEDSGIPVGVFFSLMYGSKKLSMFDWKDLYSAESMQYIFNLALKSKEQRLLSKPEIEQLKRIESLDLAPERKAKEMVAALESAISTRELRILWLEGGGDYYEFFIVKPSVAKSLDGVILADWAKFRANL